MGEQQRVEILKALYRGASFIILDEPTAVLTPENGRSLRQNGFRYWSARKGKLLVFISHKLNEVMAISDRVTVLRDGCMVGTIPGPRGNHATSWWG